MSFSPSLPLPFATVISWFHRVKKSPLIIGIVDRIKINSKSELSHTFFLQIARFDIFYFCFVYFADRSGMDKSPSVTCLLYSDVVKGDTESHVAKEISGRRRRRSREKGIQGVGDFRVKKFYYFFLFIYLFIFSITLLYHFSIAGFQCHAIQNRSK